MSRDVNFSSLVRRVGRLAGLGRRSAPRRRANLLHAPFAGEVYLEFLPRLCTILGVRNYLEIGVHFGHMLERIACDTAVGVDPGFILDTNVMAGKRRLHLYQTTSDAFFSDIDLPALLGGTVDLSFLDGLHQYEFLLRDFANAEAASAPGSVIVMHDCMPLTAEMTARDPAAVRSDPEPLNRMWTGDVWKVVPILAKYRPDLRLTFVDCPPTGLVCAAGLDPSSRVLADQAADILTEFDPMPNSAETIGAMYQAHPVVAPASVLASGGRNLFAT
jgi:hypothetical protein